MGYLVNNGIASGNAALIFLSVKVIYIQLKGHDIIVLEASMAPGRAYSW